ncbi:MAG: metallophosphoesterase [Acidaminobacter sp.]|uniref:metallophosphoesterase n=1 Tax=Acidaminobacter sp. TaxID=1872102 RepID=UPI001381DB01|nr:metallophosphoesterase [Acidaminobacter sp.]MZQ99513.1 metallophosphoesterase [Acidaminobacter sp.]
MHAFDIKYKSGWRLALIILILVGLVSAFIVGAIQGERLVFERVTVPSANVPEALKGRTIAVLSDLHGHITEENAALLLEGLREADPAAILLAGDMVDSREAYWPEARALMEALPDIAPVYYSYGNHEIENIERGRALGWLEELGITVLRNESAILALEPGGVTVTLSCLDDRIGFASERSYILAMNRLRNAGSYQILLSHRPEYAQDYAAAGFDLVVSGHAHGGQVQLPLIGPLLAPHQGFFPELAEGVRVTGNTAHVISRGLGNKVVVPRLFNPREVVLVGF